MSWILGVWGGGGGVFLSVIGGTARERRNRQGSGWATSMEAVARKFLEYSEDDDGDVLAATFDDLIVPNDLRGTHTPR